MDTTGGVDRILADVAERAALDDLGAMWFLGPLSAYAADLAQSNLTEFGRKRLRSRAVHDVERRLRVLEPLRQHAEIAAVPIPPIVYITGLERSGATLLHNLLALHRDARVLRRWELLEPVPPPETETYNTDTRIARVQSQADVLRGMCSNRCTGSTRPTPRSACAASSTRWRCSPGPPARACPRGGDSSPRRIFPLRSRTTGVRARRGASTGAAARSSTFGYSHVDVTKAASSRRACQRAAIVRGALTGSRPGLVPRCGCGRLRRRW